MKKFEESLLLYPFDNKTGKDKSDLIRGQILGVRNVFQLLGAIEEYESNKLKFKQFTDKLREGANR